MRLKRFLRGALTSLLKHYGYEVIERQTLRQWQKYAPIDHVDSRHPLLPEHATTYLLQDNPRLLGLQARYSVFNNKVTAPLAWRDGYVKPEEMLYFRGDNAYVWQLRGVNMNGPGYALASYYVKSIDERGLLDTLKEDELFGNVTFSIGGRVVSRDLLDSILEIYFLEKHLNVFSLKHLTVLDIGAGYGRLAHRMASALPNIKEYLCTDAYAISTFLSEYYIRFRKLEDRVKVVPLDEIENTMRHGSINIAVNIHSFPECRISAIQWWLSVLARYRVKYLMIVPNSDSLQTNDGKDFGKVIERHGYRLRAKEPKYRDPVVQKYAITPAYHHLFELA
jgi:hypothetical protein